MLIFDEKKYAKEILKKKKYQTIKNQGTERNTITRYLSNDLEYTQEQIVEELLKIPMYGGEYLTDTEKKKILNKVVSKAIGYEYITNLSVSIYREEFDIIESIENEKERDLLFCYLVYYKWAIRTKQLSFFSKHKQAYMARTNDNDIWKLANISKLRVSERYSLLNQLFAKGLYEIDNFKSYNYVYFPFVVNEGEEVIHIENFDNILGELKIMESSKDYKHCELCGTVIKNTNGKIKYCSKCADSVHTEQKKQWKRTRDLKRKMV